MIGKHEAKGFLEGAPDLEPLQRGPVVGAALLRAGLPGTDAARRVRQPQGPLISPSARVLVFLNDDLGNPTQYSGGPILMFACRKGGPRYL